MELEVTADGRRLKVHRAVLYAKSEWISARGNFQDGANSSSTVPVDGNVECWELIIRAMYEAPIASNSTKLLLLALELADFYAMTNGVKRALTAQLEFTPKSVFPIMVHAWNAHDEKLFQDGMLCLGENEVLLGDIKSPAYEESWAAVYNGFRRTNPQLDRALKRTTPSIDWNEEVSGMWTLPMSSLFDPDHIKRARLN
jgi:hypothetical protein